MVTGVLHCNLNVRDAAGAAAVYGALGLRVVMRSRSEGYDATPLGLPQLTRGDAWFLYDVRGGRRAPAVELLEWVDPPTTGEAYASARENGLQALRFAVDDVAVAAARLVESGARPAPDGPDEATTLLDADGARIELTRAAVEAPELRAVRVVVRDLDRAAQLYLVLGFAWDGTDREVAWAGTGDGTAARERVLVSPGPPALDLHLTAWPDGPGGRAHEQPHHRGLFRLALAVADLDAAAAVAAGADVPVGDPVFVPMPGTPLGGLRVAFLRDHDGVTVELVERELASP